MKFVLRAAVPLMVLATVSSLSAISSEANEREFSVQMFEGSVVANRVGDTGLAVDGLWLLDGDGGRVSIAPSAAPFTNVNWLPDGSGLVYRTPSAGTVDSPILPRIVHYDLASGVERTVVEAVFDPQFQIQFDNVVSSSDGSRIAYTHSQRGMSVVEFDGSGDRVVGPIANLSRQPWSPDSNRLVGNCLGFVRCINLYDVHAGTSTEVSLPDDAIPSALPVWSPVDDLIAVPSESGEVILLSPDGGVVSRLPSPDWDPNIDVGENVTTTSFLWSPDGDRLVGTDSIGALVRARRRLFLWNVGLAESPGLLREVPVSWAIRPTSWSADGAEVAFSEFNPFSGEFRVSTIDTSTLTVRDFGDGATDPVMWPIRRSVVTAATNATGDGVVVSYSNGEVETVGSIAHRGDASSLALNAPIVGMAPTHTGDGYWLLGRDGGVFSYGDAQFHGSTGNLVLDQPVVSLASDAAGRGYWFVASDGGVFAFGVPFFGSAASLPLRQPVVGMATTISGNGYWLVASDGGIFSYGPDAEFSGSAGAIDLDQPIVGMAADPDGTGYWMVAADGGVFAFDAIFYGSGAGAVDADDRVVSMVTHPAGGYWLITANGSVLGYGAAAGVSRP